jgi:hypothetical protein
VVVTGLVAALLYYWVAWMKVGRDPKRGVTSVQEFTPPDGMNPARLRALLANGRADHVSVAAELIYLADSGHLRIIERDGTYRLARSPVESAQLPPGAKEFSSAVFREGDDVELRRRKKSKELSRAAHHLKRLSKAEHGRHFLANLRYMLPGIFISVVSIGIALAVLDPDQLDHARSRIAVVCYAAFLAAVFGSLSFLFMKLLRSATKEYVNLRGRIEGYVRFLARSFADCSTTAFLPPFLQGHLPFALAAGIELNDRVIRQGEATWYHGTSGGFESGDFLKLVRDSL